MLPPGVHAKHGRYYLVRQNKWIPLTRVEEGELACLERYYELTQESPRDMAAMLLAYLREEVPRLSPETQPDYRRIILTRLIPWCGHMPLGTLRPVHVAQYLEARRQAGAAVRANREKAVLSSACAFGMRRGWLDFNPCHGVRRNKERPSSRYVEHAELVPVLDKAPPEMYLLMSAAYLTGARQTDLMRLLKSDLKAHGIEIHEGKTRNTTGKIRIVEWSPTLRQIIEAACARNADSPYVFTSARGLPWTKWGLQSALRRLKRAVPEFRFRFRDLRPKAASDSSGNVLAHDTGMLRVYQRRKRVQPVK